MISNKILLFKAQLKKNLSRHKCLQILKAKKKLHSQNQFSIQQDAKNLILRYSEFHAISKTAVDYAYLLLYIYICI